MPLAKPFSLYRWVRMGLTNLPDFRLENNPFWTEGSLQDVSRPLECTLLNSCLLSPCAEPTFHYREKLREKDICIERHSLQAFSYVIFLKSLLLNCELCVVPVLEMRK